MKRDQTGIKYYLLALVLLLCGLCFGVLAAQSYIAPGWLKDVIGFTQLRPLHVSSVMFWILLGASGTVYASLQVLKPGAIRSSLAGLQWYLWIVAIAGIFFSYFNGDFGGREYWEFPQHWSLLILAAWALMALNYFSVICAMKSPPVYIWMWGTGIAFFLFIFIENYLWLIPYFRENFIRDTTIQWKVNGALVGCWNQMIYGSSFFLMEKISGNKDAAKSKMAFAMYFLGLFNLMFNWSHHIYTLPVAPYVRYIGYVVSMTEWVILLRIIYSFRSSLSDVKKHYHHFSYRFLMAADFWVFLNLAMALLMSIPAVNLYTHGTHITVAHAMGTTIGINTMILLALIFEEVLPDTGRKRTLHTMNFWFYAAQLSLLVFWLSLITAGVRKGIWQMQNSGMQHAEIMTRLRGVFMIFNVSGVLLLLSLGVIAVYLFRALYRSGTPGSIRNGVDS